MRAVKIAAVAVGCALALYGGIALSGSARNLYDDWAFLRSARVQSLQQQQQQRQQQQQQQAARPSPAPAAPAAPAPAPPQ